MSEVLCYTTATTAWFSPQLLYCITPFLQSASGAKIDYCLETLRELSTKRLKWLEFLLDYMSHCAVGLSPALAALLWESFSRISHPIELVIFNFLTR